MSKYPHMLQNEIELWERFLPLHGKYFDRFEYDVHVGEGIPIDPAWPKNIQVAAGALTKKRIDAIGHHDNEVWIFEIKPDAGLSALGQLIAYRDLYNKTFGEPPVLFLAVITDILNPDEEYLFDLHHIRKYVV